MAPGAKIVVNEARKIAPITKDRKINKRYRTTKFINSVKARKGSGNVIATYKPGNLRGSIRRLLFRKTFREWIGPKISNRPRGNFGPGTRRFDGYTAQMVFGGAKKFKDKVMIPALSRSQGKVLQKAKQLLAKKIDEIGAKLNL